MSEFTHIDEKGHATMVDVSGKAVTHRVAIATGRIRMNRTCYEAVHHGTIEKGDVLGTARIAGIMGAKETSRLIPLCHILNLTKCAVDFTFCDDEQAIEATCLVKCNGVTGVEMEALTGVSIALLTIYDMCKAVDKSMVISDVHLVEKYGGKSGDFYFGGDVP